MKSKSVAPKAAITKATAPTSVKKSVAPKAAVPSYSKGGMVGKGMKKK
jgi:hypothetical protein